MRAGDDIYRDGLTLLDEGRIGEHISHTELSCLRDPLPLHMPCMRTGEQEYRCTGCGHEAQKKEFLGDPEDMGDWCPVCLHPALPTDDFHWRMEA